MNCSPKLKMIQTKSAHFSSNTQNISAAKTSGFENSDQCHAKSKRLKAEGQENGNSGNTINVHVCARKLNMQFRYKFFTQHLEALFGYTFHTDEI